MQRAITATITLCVLAAPTWLLAGEPETADEVISKYVEAIGGRKKLDAVKTVRMTGKNMMGNGMEAPMIIEMKQPDKVRVEFSVQGMTAVQAFDGKIGWFIMPFSGQTEPKQMAPEQVDQIKDRADVAGPLVDYKDRGYEAELVGKETVAGTEAYDIKLTKKDGSVEHYYVDAKQFLPVQIKGKQTFQGSDFEYTVSIGDYKEVNGLLLAHSMEQRVGGMGGGSIVFEQIKINDPIDDARFAMPEKKDVPEEPAPSDKPPAGSDDG